MKTTIIPFVFVLLSAATLWAADDKIGFKKTPDTTPANQFYPGNREPLLPSPLVKLPVGAVKPHGWLRKQMELMADGFSGHLDELSRFLQPQGNAWLNPKGEGDQSFWEELPYWLKGFGDLGYVLGDQRIIKEARRWIGTGFLQPARRRLLRPAAELDEHQDAQGRQARPVAQHGHAQRPAVVLRILRRPARAGADGPVLPLGAWHPGGRLPLALLAAAAGRRQPGKRLLALQPHRRAVAARSWARRSTAARPTGPTAWRTGTA